MFGYCLCRWSVFNDKLLCCVQPVLAVRVKPDAPIVFVHLSNEDPSRSVTRVERENITLKCRADARPPVTLYAWFKNVSIHCA